MKILLVFGRGEMDLCIELVVNIRCLMVVKIGVIVVVCVKLWVSLCGFVGLYVCNW